ncbi:MAG: hypothetical protein HN995_04865 [Candidatus Marinimicrobia bacterium]|jgi:hypothetical protein|nr:hypothetical protein [Candidatus Neomarinimicrobiota bacterium]MBT4129686.1 hypothetical protein [Candidatus Neomarinimicrobiota bacterium]MBT4294744.1 hypothetical protein [Candidatus Neomarinimicrobiota bacterium]MBT4418927.1 hypothetical protein [Candidatus Neomarinimicrobiota bacterium]MBT4993339.1 hypothetical protein [Candidatus Neomarinimicrobiota bacterium]
MITPHDNVSPTVRLDDDLQQPGSVNSADVFMVDYNEAVQFGRRNGLIYTPEPS